MSEQEKPGVWATPTPVADLFDQKVEGVAHVRGLLSQTTGSRSREAVASASRNCARAVTSSLGKMR